MIWPYRILALLRRKHVRAAFNYDPLVARWRWRKTDIVPKERWGRFVSETMVRRSSAIRAYWGKIRGIQKIIPEMRVDEIRHKLAIPEERQRIYEIMKERDYETPKIKVGW